MIQLIRDRGIIGILLGVLVIIFSKVFFEPVPDFIQVTYTPLFSALKSSIEFVPNLDIILGITFIIVQASLLTYFLNYHKVISERSYFPFILYILFAGVYNEQFYLNPASFLNFFLILILDRMLRLQDSGKTPGVLFLDIGTLIGVAVLFSKEAIFYIPIIIIGCLIIYSYSIQRIIIIMLSVFTVLFLTACTYFLIGKFEQFSLFFQYIPINLSLNFSHWQERFYFLLLIFLIASILSYFHFQFRSKKITNKSRRFAGVFVLLWFIGLAIVVFQELNLWCNMALNVIPLTVFSTNYFQDTTGKDWFKNLLFVLLIISLINIQINY